MTTIGLNKALVRSNMRRILALVLPLRWRLGLSRLQHPARSRSFGRIWSVIEEKFLSNWQLALLASTAIALSLASGYTTFDGLRSFTSAPLLSVLISFGVQGVMLIIAWLIGENFAANIAQRNTAVRPIRLLDATLGMLLGVVFLGLVFYWVLHQYDALRLTTSGFKTDIERIVDVSLCFLLVLVLVAILGFGFRRGGAISTSYVQSLRLIAKNAVLWVMLLSTMGASVFFSFDSHFNAIFPAEARKRAAEIRTTSQIGAVVADIGALTQKRLIEAAERLFDSGGWKAYDAQLASVAEAAKGAQAEIENYFVRQVEVRRTAIAQQQERMASALSAQAGLAGKKLSLTEELVRLRAERPGVAAEFTHHKNELDAKAKEIDIKRVEAMAEDRGVEGSLKQGKGPLYRQRMGELATLQVQFKIEQERASYAQKRLTAVEARIAQLERELSIIDGDLAKLKGEAFTAEQRIKAAELLSSDARVGQPVPIRALFTFESTRSAFRQQPDRERLVTLHLQCTQLTAAMQDARADKERLRAIDCDPKLVTEAAARVFALNDGLAAYRTNCAGGEQLARHTTTDALLAFGRRCLQDSGLVNQDSANIGVRLSAIEMNRDDKAHRFVVSWNAFLDGNRLAYLSLILAIGVDALVFMAGLFGAQALRSPLSDLPSPKARSAHQLESIIDAVLLPDTFNKARMAREAMHPIDPVEGFTNVVKLNELDPESASHVRDVLNAGAAIGAVRQTGRFGEYLVRAELYEFLCSVIKKELKHRPQESRRALELDELEMRLTEALLPYIGETADAVLRHLHPINDLPGFTSEISMTDIEPHHMRPVRNVLIAASSLGVVQRDNSNRDRFYVRGDLYRVLARIRAKEMVGADPGALQLAADMRQVDVGEAHWTGRGSLVNSPTPRQASDVDGPLGQLQIWRTLPGGLGLRSAWVNYGTHIAQGEPMNGTRSGHDFGRVRVRSDAEGMNGTREVKVPLRLPGGKIVHQDQSPSRILTLDAPVATRNTDSEKQK